MTEKQIDRVKKKIEKFKKALAADKKFWRGDYHDAGAIRYLPPEQFIKIQDYKGGLRYLNWFDKHFPMDGAHAIFLFEYTLILFKCGKLKEAEKKAHRAFFSNIYLTDKFLGKKLPISDKRENSSWELKMVNDHFKYFCEEPDFIEFAEWLEKILNKAGFLEKFKEFLEIEKQLINAPVGKNRSDLVDRLFHIEYG